MMQSMVMKNIKSKRKDGKETFTRVKLCIGICIGCTVCAGTVTKNRGIGM